MKIIIYAVIFLTISGYLFYIRDKKALREAGLTGKVFCRTFTISLNDPLDESLSVELISINEDGSATIKTPHNDEILTAKRSGYFIGEDFGEFGLQLVSISEEGHEIKLKHSTPEYFE